MIMPEPAQVFVKIDEYREILDVINVIKAKIDEAKHILKRINELKAEEDNEVEMWASSISDVERKIASVDKTLFDTENA
ncbi:hypothetical protein D6764_00765 [Candidatus Woesearchaeota archaeon]|nr:MAG: hypothetical protein D6764_00765 [Candidatus Woesearchaeota archaeon]